MKIGDVINQDGLWRREFKFGCGFKRIVIEGKLQGFVVCNVNPLVLYPDPVEWKIQQDKEIRG